MRRLLQWLGGALLGLAMALMLVVLVAMHPWYGFEYNIDSRSLDGVSYILYSAIVAVSAGALTAFVRPVTLVALTTLTLAVIAFGVWGIAATGRGLEGMVMTFVVGPGCVLGGVLGRRLRRWRLETRPPAGA